MPSTISAANRRWVRERANFICEYCQSAELLTGLKCEIDHIVPRALGGTDNVENLCAACSVCNGHKHSKVEGIDPETDQTVSIFHPRQQAWHENFQWSRDGSQILGITTCGRATIEALNLNAPLRVVARRIWAQTGRHPPK